MMYVPTGGGPPAGRPLSKFRASNRRMTKTFLHGIKSRQHVADSPRRRHAAAPTPSIRWNRCTAKPRRSSWVRLLSAAARTDARRACGPIPSPRDKFAPLLITGAPRTSSLLNQPNSHGTITQDAAAVMVGSSAVLIGRSPVSPPATRRASAAASSGKMCDTKSPTSMPSPTIWAASSSAGRIECG